MKIKIDPLDTLFSKFIRLRAIARVGGCERCFAPKKDIKELECSHFFGRARKSVRWDEDNAAGLCFGCHQYLGSQPHEHEIWFKARLGDKFDLLNGRQRIPSRFLDKAAIKIYLNARIEEVIECQTENG